MARHALVVGINRYARKSQLGPLEYAEKDATEIARVLKDRRRGKCDVSLLVGGKTSAWDVNKALDLICRRAKYDDTAILYFAGHGKTDRRGDFCFCLFDTTTNSLVRTALHARTLQAYLNNSNCRQFAIFFDACFSGAAGRELLGARGSRPSDVSLRELAVEGRVIVSSCTAYQPAREDKGLGHGEFTYHLLASLREHGGDQSGNINVSALYTDIFKRMEKAGSEQLPMIWRGEVGDIVIARSLVSPTRSQGLARTQRRHPFAMPTSYVHCRLASEARKRQSRRSSTPEMEPRIPMLLENPRTGQVKPLDARIEPSASVSVFPESAANEMDLTDMGAVRLATGPGGSRMEISTRYVNLHALGPGRKRILLNQGAPLAGFTADEALPGGEGILGRDILRNWIFIYDGPRSVIAIGR